MTWAIHVGDCRHELARMPAGSVDAVVCDPPYGLSNEPDMAEVLAHWLAGDDYTHTGGGFVGADVTTDVWDCVEGCPVALMDTQSGVQRDGVAVRRNLPAAGASQQLHVKAPTQRGDDVGYGGEGGASRFFYQAKANRRERQFGLPDIEILRCEHCNSETDNLGRWIDRRKAQPDRRQPEPTDGTSPPPATSADASTAEWSSPTSTCGSNTTDPSQPDITSTTETETSSTTTSPTCSSSPRSSTSASTPDANSATTDGGSHADSAARSSPSPASTGTSVPKGGPSTGDADPVTSARLSRPSACGVCGRREVVVKEVVQRRNDHPT